MKKSALFLGFLLILFCLVKCGGPKECATNKILNDPIFDPSWVGDCINDSAEGQGILYDYFGQMKYKGEMKNGSPNGAGIYFGDYMINGDWINGIPQNANYYLREVMFSPDHYPVFIENGLRLNVKQHYSTEFYLTNYFFIDSMLSAIDSLDFAARLEKDTLYRLEPKKNTQLPSADSADCAAHVFYTGYRSSSGINYSSFYNFYIVQCKNGSIRKFFKQEKIGKSSSEIEVTWKRYYPIDSPNPEVFYSPFALMKHACGCE